LNNSFEWVKQLIFQTLP